MFILITITDPEIVTNEIEIINSLFNLGLQTLHLRKPKWDKDQMARLVLGINEEHRKKIMIHSQYELAFEYKLKGIHFTNEYLLKSSAEEISTTFNHAKQNSMVVSSSSHSLSELANLKCKFDYVFLSPVFDSISKADYSGNFELSELKIFFQTHTFDTKIIALGGIYVGNILSVLDAGFDGAAVLGAIWNQKNKTEIFQKINSVIELTQRV